MKRYLPFQTPLEILTAAQKVWDTAHSVPVKQIGNGEDYYLAVQRGAGDAISFNLITWNLWLMESVSQCCFL